MASNKSHRPDWEYDPIEPKSKVLQKEDELMDLITGTKTIRNPQPNMRVRDVDNGHVGTVIHVDRDGVLVSFGQGSSNNVLYLPEGLEYE